MSTAADTQRRNALKIGNEKRKAVKAVRVKLECEAYTLEDVLLPSAMKIVQHLPVVDVIRWVPRFGPRADTNWAKLGAAAVHDGVNLMVVAGGMSPRDRRWVVDYVMRPALTAQERSARSRAPLGVVEPLDVQRLKNLLARAEKDRDAALLQVEALSRQCRGLQMTMPTVEAEMMLADLADAVELHRRTVTDPASSGARWANADEALWERKNEILLSAAPPKLQVA